MCLSFVFSCKNEKEEAPDVGYGYAPLTIGQYVIYDVDSTVYDDFNHDTVYYKYRIKQKLEENFTDDQGRAAIKMIRYIKMFDPNVNYNNMPWIIKDVWVYIRTNTTLEVVEENVRFSKLIFPVVLDATWNGNANNSSGSQDYKYNYIDQGETINGATFDNVLFVEQKDDKNKNHIHREYFVEKYAKDVGLVYKEIKDLQSFTVTVNANGIVPVEDRINKGVKYKMTYVTHGIE